MFALPGGFVGASEAPEQTAERKLREKTGVGSVHLEQLRTYARSRARPARLAALDRLHGAGAGRRRCPRSAPPTATRPGTRSTRCPSSRSTTRSIVDDGLWRLHARVADKVWFVRKALALLTRAVHAAPGAAALRGAARRGGRRRQLPPRRPRDRPARGHRRRCAPKVPDVPGACIDAPRFCQGIAKGVALLCRRALTRSRLRPRPRAPRLERLRRRNAHRRGHRRRLGSRQRHQLQPHRRRHDDRHLQRARQGHHRVRERPQAALHHGDRRGRRQGRPGRGLRLRRLDGRLREPCVGHVRGDHGWQRADHGALQGRGGPEREPRFDRLGCGGHGGGRRDRERQRRHRSRRVQRARRRRLRRHDRSLRRQLQHHAGGGRPGDDHRDRVRLRRARPRARRSRP